MPHQFQQGAHDLSSYRATSLSVGNLSVCERISFRCRLAGRRSLDDRLRYATQAKVAVDRFLLAYLSGLQSCHLLAELMKDFRGPTIAPGLDHSPAFPMQGIGHEKTRCIRQVLLLVHNDQPFAPIALQPDGLRKRPVWLLLTIATLCTDGTKALRVLSLQLRCHNVHSAPLAIPLDVARALQLAHPVFAMALKIPRQLQMQDPIVKGIVRLWKLALFLKLLDDLPCDLRSLAILQLMVAVM